MVIKNKNKLQEDLPTIELTIKDMEQNSFKSTTDSSSQAKNTSEVTLC